MRWSPRTLLGGLRLRMSCSADQSGGRSDGEHASKDDDHLWVGTPARSDGAVGSEVSMSDGNPPSVARLRVDDKLASGAGRFVGLRRTGMAVGLDLLDNSPGIDTLLESAPIEEAPKSASFDFAP